MGMQTKIGAIVFTAICGGSAQADAPSSYMYNWHHDDDQTPAAEKPPTHPECHKAYLQQAAALLYFSPDRSPFADEVYNQNKNGPALLAARTADYEQFLQKHFDEILRKVNGVNAISNVKVHYNYNNGGAVRSFEASWKDDKGPHSVRYSLAKASKDGEYYNKNPKTGDYEVERRDVIKVDALGADGSDKPSLCRGNAHWYLSKGARISDLRKAAGHELELKHRQELKAK